MATIKTITRFSQSPAAPTEIPDTALVLIEIDNQVYRTTYGEISGGGGGEPFDLTALPGYSASEVQVLTNNEGTIGWVTDAG